MYVPELPSRRVWRYSILVLSVVTWLGVLFWAFFGLGGLGSTRKLLFNWHPVIMTAAVVVFLPHAALAWSDAALHDELGKKSTKLIHAVLNIVVFVLVNIGILVAFTSHQQQRFANFYSLHSWFGLITLGLLKGNVFAGLASWMFPESIVSSFSKCYHRNVGKIGLLTANFTMVLGFLQQQSLLNRVARSVFTVAAVSANVLGLLSFSVLTMVLGLMASGRKSSKSVDEVENECTHG